MTSKEDDTLPLPEELPIDITADEDIIPTSQPQGSGCTKASKNSETSSNKSSQELNSSATIDDTLLCEALQTTLDKDKSSDFIPDSEAKKIRVTYPKEKLSCKKKLPVFANICQIQSDPLWETHEVPESPAMESHQLSILNDTPSGVQPPEQDMVGKEEKSATEIIVNDSAETVDIEGSPVKGIKGESDAGGVGEKSSFSYSNGSDVGRCEETQIFDSSSVVLLEQPGRCSMMDESEKSIKGTTPEDLYLMKTVDDSETDLQLKLIVSECTPPAVTDTSGKFDVKEEAEDATQLKGKVVSKEEEESGNAIRGQNAAIRKLEFKLLVTCLVTFDTKTNKVLKKFITKVHENPKGDPKLGQLERLSDNTSDKRYSTSSSGSVYSDKLPFVLSKRISTVSDQTDSSEEDLVAFLKQEKKALRRVPWGNEFLLPLKLDDLVQVSIEREQFSEWPSPKPRTRISVTQSKGSTEGSSSEAKSGLGSECLGVGSSAEEVIKETRKSAESFPADVEKTTGKESPVGGESEFKEGSGNAECVEREEESSGGKATEAATEAAEAEEAGAVAVGGEESVAGSRVEEKEKAKKAEAEGRCSVMLCEGLAVLARWTDKRYYSGVLCGSEKNDRWEVKFDDGTLKTVREDFIMPRDWLEVGALVFALVDDKYVSGQIMEIEQGKEVTYTVALDVKKQNVSVRVSDLCLTDVLAGIIREKYKPSSGTPRGRADIDFDNVVSGKRLREQRTPLRPAVGVGGGSSGEKKKSSSRVKKDVLAAIKETPVSSSNSGRRATALKSESGHLAEDRVVSTDSPSGSELGEGTPLRRTSKESRGKTKPRTLSYEPDESRSSRSKSKSWLTADGTPIPGPSGLKFKRQKPKSGADDADEPARKKVETGKGTRSFGKGSAPASAEKSKKKRKLEESVEDGVRKKSLKKGDVRVKGGRSKKG